MGKEFKNKEIDKVNFQSKNFTPCKNLKYLSDHDLDQSLKALVKKENALLAEIILHIQEVEVRRLYLKMHYGSLFDYLTKHMGYSNGPAQRRIDAARLSNDVPSLIEDLKKGELNLSQVALVQQCVRESEKEKQTAVSVEAKTALLQNLKQKSVFESQVLVSKALDIKVKTNPKVTYQADESVRLEVSFTKEQWAKLERMRSLVSHSLPDGSWDQVFEYVADRVIASKTNVRTDGKEKANGKAILAGSVGSKINDLGRDREISTEDAKAPKVNAGAHPLNGTVNAKLNTKRSYYQLRKDLLKKHNSCQHVDSSSMQKCTSTWKLQIDHIRPRWAGGEDEAKNLTVLCARHNRLRYQEQAGIRRR